MSYSLSLLSMLCMLLRWIVAESGERLLLFPFGSRAVGGETYVKVGVRAAPCVRMKDMLQMLIIDRA